MSAVQDELGLRLQQVLPGLCEHDWSDVVDRSALLRVAAPRRRRIAPRVLVLIALAVVLAGGSLALAVTRHEVLSTAPPQPPLPAAARQLIDLDLRFRSGPTDTTSDQIIPGFARRVLTLETSRGTVASLWIAQTQQGRSCYAAIGKPFGSSSCDAPAGGRFPVLVGSSRGSARGRVGHEMTLVGRVASPAATHVRLVYADGRSGSYPLVDRWFMFEVPDAHTLARTEPIRIEALAASGRVVGARADPFRLRVARPVRTRPAPSSIRRLAVAALPDHGGRVAIYTGRDTTGRPCFRWTRNGAGKRYPEWMCSPAVGVSAISALGKVQPAVPVQWMLASVRGGTRAPGVGWAYAVGWAGPSVHVLTVRFEDGRAAAVALTGRSFLLVIGRTRWTPGHRPSELVARGAGGAVVYRRSLDPGAHCVYPGKDPVCGHVMTSDGTG